MDVGSGRTNKTHKQGEGRTEHTDRGGGGTKCTNRGRGMKCMINHSNNRTKDVKIVYISNLSQFTFEGVRWGGNQIPNFPKFKIVHIIQGWGGVK